MILECAQMLCAVHHIIDPNYERYEPRYKLTHKNHPCTIWARTSMDNYLWLCSLGLELCKEYTYRYGKVHACQPYIEEMFDIVPDIPDIGFTPPAQAMPDEYKDDNPIEAYRTYYLHDKARMLSWKGRVADRIPPDWYGEFLIQFEDYRKYYSELVLAELVNS